MKFGSYNDEVIEVVNWGSLGFYVRTFGRLFKINKGKFLELRTKLRNEVAGKDKRKK